MMKGCDTESYGKDIFDPCWRVYNATEDDCIEYCRCSEKLGESGLEKAEIEKRTLNCDTCIFCGRCNVERENVFLGVKTC
jgi:hypothetical protein